MSLYIIKLSIYIWVCVCNKPVSILLVCNNSDISSNFVISSYICTSSKSPEITVYYREISNTPCTQCTVWKCTATVKFLFLQWLWENWTFSDCEKIELSKAPPESWKRMHFELCHCCHKQEIWSSTKCVYIYIYIYEIFFFLYEIFLFSCRTCL